MEFSLNPAPVPDVLAVVKETTTKDFERDVLQKSLHKPVIVDFWAPWCGPCKQLMPLLEKAVAATNGAVEMVKVNIDNNPELSSALRIQSVPTVFAFFQGQPVDGFMGAQPESAIKTFIDKLLKLSGGKMPETGLDAAAIKKLLAPADAAFADKNWGAAMEKFSAVLEADPENAQALSGIAWCLLAEGDRESVEEMLSQLSEARKNDAAFKGLSWLLAQTAETNNETRDFAAQVLKNPKDHAARFALARQKLAAGALEDAIDALVEITRQDRAWQEQKARKLLVEIFEALGPRHPLAAAGRRRLSSVLFS